MLKSHFLFYLLPLLALCQNSITDFDALDDTTTTTTTATPPPDPFQEDVEEDLQNLDEKLDELDSESQDLVIDYVRNGRKLYGDGKVIKIQDEMYHFSCFKCATCQRTLGVSPCFTDSSIGPFRCNDCHREATSPICHGCKNPTFEKCIVAFDVFWHEACFKCKGCNRQFKRQEYLIHEGCAYDEDCYYRVVQGIVTPQRGEIRE
uniref:LIM zinc-binding domain-containing protein n=1 Tax=Caenorhabditis japonica TaxID=281687 RepID=A0A8R1HSE5_CAEJA